MSDFITYETIVTCALIVVFLVIAIGIGFDDKD